MSKPALKKTLKYQSELKLPPLTSVKTEWDLPNLYYHGTNDPNIETDIADTEYACRTFAKRYKKRSFTDTSKTLAAAITHYFALHKTKGDRVMRYFFFRQTLDANDHAAERAIAQYSERLTKANNLLLFFELTIGKISKPIQRKFLSAPELAPYRYFLERVFLEARHTLSEAEEQILNLKSAPARTLWIAGTDKILNRRTVTYKKQTISLLEAIEKNNTLGNIERPKLWDIVTTELKACADIAENELNAIVTDKKINDELRGYTKPYEAKVQSYENDLQSVEALVEAISTKGFSLSHKFYRTKAMLHGQKSISYANRYGSLGVTPHIAFADAIEICRDVFYRAKSEYGLIFDTMLQNGQLDVYPKARRSGGAFMSAGTNVPSMVFLNQVDTFQSLETLAHEMGHAIHSERSKVGQPTWYEDYSTTTAETASTFFEQLLFDALYQQADSATKFTLLHDRLTRDIATMQRQIAFFNFEVALHTHIRTHGAMSSEEIASLCAHHLRSYLGAAVDVRIDDGYSYVFIGHFRSMFYVYTYAYGHLMSSLLLNNYQKDPAYIEKIDDFLCSGSHDTVERIFRKIGINAHKVETFTSALDRHAMDVNEFVRLAKNFKPNSL